MVSVKFILCFVTLIVAGLVAAHPKGHNRHICARPRHTIPDSWIERYFVEIDVTVGCDYDWVTRQIELIECQQTAPEYEAIIKLYEQFQDHRRCFDTCYEDIYSDIFGRVIHYRKKYSPLSICYTERIVSARKSARSRLFPDLCKFRTLYYQVLALIDEFCTKYSIDRLPRSLAFPRGNDYNFGVYFPISPRSKDISLIYQNAFKDYRYLYDIIRKIDFPYHSPLSARRKKLYDDVINIWVDFDDFRRGIDIKYYPRFLDCWEKEDEIDIIYLEILNSLRPYQVKFGNSWYEIYFDLEDLCDEANIPFIDYVDWNQWTPNAHCRGSYLPSPLLRDYYNNILVTCGMDYFTARRLWNELDLKRDAPEWRHRRENLRELKRRLMDIERAVNRLIRDVIRKINQNYINNLDNFDVAQRVYIDEVIVESNNELWPLILAFRDKYYVNDDYMLPIFNTRGLKDVTRNVIPSQTYGYDISVYCCDQDLRDLIQWFEGCIRNNFYTPVSDLVQVRFDEKSEEYTLRSKSLKDLECIWLDYRKVLNDLFRKIILVLGKRRCAFGGDDYRREIKRVVEWLRPRLIILIDRFKHVCSDINDILERLYVKNTDTRCSRSYQYTETSFEITVSTTVRTI